MIVSAPDEQLHLSVRRDSKLKSFDSFLVWGSLKSFWLLFSLGKSLASKVRAQQPAEPANAAGRARAPLRDAPQRAQAPIAAATPPGDKPRPPRPFELVIAATRGASRRCTQRGTRRAGSGDEHCSAPGRGHRRSQGFGLSLGG